MRTIFCLSVLAVVALTTSASAARNTGSCSITPSPATVGEQFTIAASGIPNDTILDLFVKDSSGNSTWVDYFPLTANNQASYTTSRPSADTWTYLVVKHNSGAHSFVLAGQKVIASCTVTVT